MPVQLNGADLITSFSDYEEGTFTPEIADDNLDGSGESQAYTTQIGRYTKIGNRVSFTINMQTSSVGCLTTSESARIVGLPFTALNLANNQTAFAAGFGDLFALTAGYNVGGEIQSNNNYMFLRVWDATTGATNLLISEWSADGAIRISGVYEI